MNRKGNKRKIAHKIDDKPFQIIFFPPTPKGPVLGRREGGSGGAVCGRRGPSPSRAITKLRGTGFARGNACKSEGEMMNYLLPLFVRRQSFG